MTADHDPATVEPWMYHMHGQDWIAPTTDAERDQLQRPALPRDRTPTERCRCSCHSCCVPLDASCEDCEDNHDDND